MLPDGTSLEYDRGAFDDWCVYEARPDGKRTPPQDIDYFQTMKDLAAVFGAQRVYDDYVIVYRSTGREAGGKTLEVIESIAQRYAGDGPTVQRVLTILHMAMVAEENKRNTRLGKRIKRLGIHRLLIEEMHTREAANFMRGMQWREIDRLCKDRGF
ncbi:MAG: hypothetical protein GX616_26385 [Planctomycetes bacterium]|nr:hypothetical protein [Planctomycetota bacterium]